MQNIPVQKNRTIFFRGTLCPSRASFSLFSREYFLWHSFSFFSRVKFLLCRVYIFEILLGEKHLSRALFGLLLAFSSGIFDFSPKIFKVFSGNFCFFSPKKKLVKYSNKSKRSYFSMSQYQKSKEYPPVKKYDHKLVKQ